ncbi:MAG: 4'-phosphopantetheinyl transferase superfamily protein [Burkholderiales bacterium]|nr:4'-phosphopantetheinyl transferase superfamily protein [Burkholderiales bacterium]
MLPPPDEIHLWFALDAECTPELLELYKRDFLSEEELVRGARFHFERDRNQFVLTRALVRSVLSRYAAIPPAQWQFGKGEHGRPFIANPDAPAIAFNLSHTRGLVVLAVSQAQPLGVDVENFQTREAPLEVAQGYFSPTEVAALTSLPLAAQQERFFHYWTLKEAYIKAESKGLSLPLEQFSMLFASDNEVEIAFHDLPASSGWHFWLMQACPGFLTALCVQSEARRAPTLVARQCLPLTPDRVLKPQIMRQSHWGEA